MWPQVSSCRRKNNSLGEPGQVIHLIYVTRCRYAMPHLRDDAPSARKLRRPAALLVATISSCGKKTITPGGPPVERIATRKFFALVEYASLDSAVFKGSLDARNARGFQNTTDKKKKKDPFVLIEKQFNRRNARLF
jgi:hypothetical protein